jgi:hypothetical protein
MWISCVHSKGLFFFKIVDCTCCIKREAEEFYIFTMGIKPPTNTTKKLRPGKQPSLTPQLGELQDTRTQHVQQPGAVSKYPGVALQPDTPPDQETQGVICLTVNFWHRLA